MASTTLMILGFLWLLPVLVAVLRLHRNTPAITALDVLFGWTGIGWGIAMVWSLTSNTEGD